MTPGPSLWGIIKLLSFTSSGQGWGYAALGHRRTRVVGVLQGHHGTVTRAQELTTQPVRVGGQNYVLKHNKCAHLEARCRFPLLDSPGP